MNLYKHQAEAVEVAGRGENYILTTGTGSGKSLSCIIPIVNSILEKQPKSGIQAMIVYPMNALVNSQNEELENYLGTTGAPVAWKIYTGQERNEARKGIIENSPNILLTNYMMLELILTRSQEKPLVEALASLDFLVFDELHTYRGRQGADVALLIRRLRAASGRNFQCVGTSATLAGEGSFNEKRKTVAKVAETIFGATFRAENVIMETLRPDLALVETDDSAFMAGLCDWINKGAAMPKDKGAFLANPLARWLNGAIGMRKADGRLERAEPRPGGSVCHLHSQKMRLPSASLATISISSRIFVDESVPHQLPI